METKEILVQIEKLPLEKRMLLIEQALKSIRENEINLLMRKAVEELKEEYKTNKDLTAFTDIDFEHFYESR